MTQNHRMPQEINDLLALFDFIDDVQAAISTSQSLHTTSHGFHPRFYVRRNVKWASVLLFRSNLGGNVGPSSRADRLGGKKRVVPSGHSVARLW